MRDAGLINLYDSRSVNRISQFAGAARDLDVMRFWRWYDGLVQHAPRRHERGKHYLEGRTGITSSGASSNQREHVPKRRDRTRIALPRGWPYSGLPGGPERVRRHPHHRA